MCTFVHKTHINKNTHNTGAPYRESASAASPVISITTAAADLQQWISEVALQLPASQKLMTNMFTYNIMLLKNEINSHGHSVENMAEQGRCAPP